MDKQTVEVNELIDALFQKLPRNQVIKMLREVLPLPKEDFEELNELCKRIDEEQATNQ